MPNGNQLTTVFFGSQTANAEDGLVVNGNKGECEYVDGVARSAVVGAATADEGDITRLAEGGNLRHTCECATELNLGQDRAHGDDQKEG